MSSSTCMLNHFHQYDCKRWIQVLRSVISLDIKFTIFGPLNQQRWLFCFSDWVLEVDMKQLLEALYLKGVGEGGQGGTSPPLSKVGGGHKWVCAPPPPPPTFGQSKCSNFTICSYFVVKNNFFFSKFSWLASLANFNKSIFSKLC